MDPAGGWRLQPGGWFTDPHKVLAPDFMHAENIRTAGLKIASSTLTATQLLNLAFIVPLGPCRWPLSIGGACSTPDCCCIC